MTSRKFLMELSFADLELCYNTTVLEKRLQAMSSGTIRFPARGTVGRDHRARRHPCGHGTRRKKARLLRRLLRCIGGGFRFPPPPMAEKGASLRKTRIVKGKCHCCRNTSRSLTLPAAPVDQALSVLLLSATTPASSN